jgi:two-component system response regulator (stage 0 sporulation protein F)
MENKNTILYIDDEIINLYVFDECFNEKFNVITAESGFKGIEILRSNPEIKVIISDMKMPGMNGIEFISKAKNEFPHIICFLLTGYDITQDIANAINDKLILRYFNKPFNMEEIEHSIEISLTV